MDFLPPTPHAIGEFAQSLNHGQRRPLRFRRIAGTKHQFEIPCERTFERLLKEISCDPLREVYSEWMATLDPEPLKVLHLDGKAIGNADPAPARLEATVAAHLPKRDLAGVLVVGDAAHTVKANCRLITQEKGGDYLFFLKGNQPKALAKAEQLLLGALPPSGSVDRQGTRGDRAAEPLGHGGGCQDPGDPRGGAGLPHRPEG